MIPYLEVPDLTFGTWRIEPFTLLVVAAVLTGHFHFLARTRRRGIDLPVAAGMSLWVCVGGFIGSHLLKLVYDPAILVRGWTGLFNIFNGMSSFGGLAGALLAMPLYFRFNRVEVPARAVMVDCLAYVFPFAWVFGRMGCAISHDHLGIRAASIWAVAFPGGPRYDLGLLELLFIVSGIVPLFLWLDRKQHAPGTYPGVFLTIYGLFRIMLDQLHEDPPRYLGITIDQCAGAVAVFAGLWFLHHSRRATTSPRP
jgi:phosphatidylglycerol:prolipoprotein diacylglycerol transferase